MRGKAIFSITWAGTVRPLFCASALSAGVLLCAFPAHADDRDQLKSIQADIASKERAVRQQQQQRATLLAQLKVQEEAISAAARKLRETQSTLNELNKQIDAMNASIAKLEQQKASQERNLAAQLDAAFRQGEHSGVQYIFNSEETARGERMQAYYGYLNQARQETIAQLKQTREEVAAQRAEQRHGAAVGRPHQGLRQSRWHFAADAGVGHGFEHGQATEVPGYVPGPQEAGEELFKQSEVHDCYSCARKPSCRYGPSAPRPGTGTAKHGPPAVRGRRVRGSPR